MSLYGSLIPELDEDPFFGHMRQMNNLMSSMFANPLLGMMDGSGGFGMPGFGPMHMAHRHAMMPMNMNMNMNRLLGDMDHSLGNSSYSSSTYVMSSGLDGRPQVYSATSSTQIGPNGVKETRKTVQDSRTGTKKMSIGHHIHDRAHIIEKEQNVRNGDTEEKQEFINIEEDEADDFNREFEEKVRGSAQSRHRLTGVPRALPALPSSTSHRRPSSRSSVTPSSRRALRTVSASPLAITYSPSSNNAAVRQTYSSLHSQRPKHRGSRVHNSNTNDY